METARFQVRPPQRSKSASRRHKLFHELPPELNSSSERSESAALRRRERPNSIECPLARSVVGFQQAQRAGAAQWRTDNQLLFGNDRCNRLPTLGAVFAWQPGDVGVAEVFEYRRSTTDLWRLAMSLGRHVLHAVAIIIGLPVFTAIMVGAEYLADIGMTAVGL
jgi:hypothetical protein